MTTGAHLVLGAVVGALAAVLPDAALALFGWRTTWLPSWHPLVRVHHALHHPELWGAGLVGYLSHIVADRFSRHRRRPQVVLCASGGMDSVAIWQTWGRPPCVFACYGQPYELREREAVTRWMRAYPDADVRWVMLPAAIGQAQRPDGHVPFRNLWMVMAALAAYPDADEVWLGATAGETSPDKSRRWARRVSRALSATRGRPVRVRLPARHLTKTDLMRQVAAASPVFADFAWQQPSCYAIAPAGAGCGRCMSCLRRAVAARLCGRRDQVFEVDPLRAPLPGTGGGWWRYLWAVPLRDWWGVARNNAQLLRARRLARQAQGVRRDA